MTAPGGTERGLGIYAGDEGSSRLDSSLVVPAHLASLGVRDNEGGSQFVLGPAVAMLYSSGQQLEAHEIHAPSGRCAQGRLKLAQGQARHRLDAADLPPVRLCRHRQDHARHPSRGSGGRRSKVRRLHRQGGFGDARQRLPRRHHHPLADLPRPRERRGNPELRPVGRSAGVEGLADHHRRMLDGRCRTRPRPPVVRRAAAGARRSGAIAADHQRRQWRRLLHRARARRDAHRSASPGAGQSDHPPVDGYPRRRISRARPLRRD